MEAKQEEFSRQLLVERTVEFVLGLGAGNEFVRVGEVWSEERRRRHRRLIRNSDRVRRYLKRRRF